MKLLSVDIGIKNLGWCIVETGPEPPGLIRTEVTNIDGGTLRESIDRLLEVLAPQAAAVDTVLIEQQPLQHAKMLSIMYALYGGLRALGHTVEIVSPRLRVSFLGLSKDITYAQRKKAGVARVSELYGEAVLQGHGKKLDDLSDSILQALAWTARSQTNTRGRKKAPPAATAPAME